MNGSVYLMPWLVSLLFGVIAGLRTFTAPAAVAWTVHLGRLDLTGSWLGFFGHAWVRWLLTAMALFELVADQLPFMASRTVPSQFTGRLVSGALSGAAVGASVHRALGGAIAGGLGAIVGTLVGLRARTRLARALHNDHPAGLIEDAVAIGGALLVGLAA
jgi:uncharacterized membrane protein